MNSNVSLVFIDHGFRDAFLSACTQATLLLTRSSHLFLFADSKRKNDPNRLYSVGSNCRIDDGRGDASRRVRVHPQLVECKYIIAMIYVGQLFKHPSDGSLERGVCRFPLSLTCHMRDTEVSQSYQTA